MPKHPYIVLLVFSLLLLSVSAAAQDRALFQPTTPAQIAAAAELPPLPAGTQRQRLVTLNADALASAAESVPLGRDFSDAGLLLNLFEDRMHVAENSALAPREGLPGYVWTGHLRGQPLSDVVLVVDAEGRVSGRVSWPGHTTLITPLGTAGLHRIAQVRPEAVTPSFEDDYLLPPEVNRGVLPLPPAVQRADTGDLIDLMVVYTPAALDYYGSHAALVLGIEAMVAMTNQSYVNSAVNQRVRLVEIHGADYVERPAALSNDLSALTYDDDGFMDEVHSLRADYAADLVLLLASTPNDTRNYCGLAWLLSGANRFGFSVIEAVCEGTVAMPHELGHNMGSQHDAANGGANGGYFAYSIGYQDPIEGVGDWGDFVTIMAYSRNGQCPADNPTGDIGENAFCPYVLRWSTPDQTQDGKPLGSLSTNNVLSLDQTAVIVAGFFSGDDRPDRPADLSAVLDADGHALLTWTLAPAADSIRLERSTDAVTYAPIAAGMRSTYTDTDLHCGRRYHYRVVSLEAGMESIPSRSVYLDAPDCTLSAPTGLSAAGSGAQAIALTWTPPGGDAEEVVIERQDPQTGVYIQIGVIDAAQTTFSDADAAPLACSAAYRYRLYAQSGPSQSAPTDTVSAAPTACDLLVNGGFEQSVDAGAALQPTAWTVSGGSNKDKIRCNKTDRPEGKPDKIVAHNGECAFRISGEPGENTRLKQVLSALDALNAGDTLAFSAYLDAKRLSRGLTLRLKVQYADGRVDKDKLQVAEGGSAAYALYSTPPVMLSGTPARVSAVIRYKRAAASGRVFIDDAALMHTLAGSQLVPLPDADAAAPFRR